MSHPVILIDADPLVYRAGFASQSSSYECVFTDADGKMHHKIFSATRNKQAGQAKKDFIAAHPDWTLEEASPLVEAEPLTFALSGVKRTIQACVRDCLQHLQRATGRRSRYSKWDTHLYLTGPGNYREKVGTILPYKGNRKAEKPVHYQAIRGYLQEHWRAKMVEGHEADDECSIVAGLMRGRGSPTIVCTIDKDLDQIPGYHYDYAKKVWYAISDEDARFMFWRQVISGDSVDNIQGMYKIGEAKAINLLEKALEGGIPLDSDQLWGYIVALYADNMAKYPDKFPEGMSPQEAALETARLVKMQDYYGQLWTPPGLPDEETT